MPEVCGFSCSSYSSPPPPPAKVSSYPTPPALDPLRFPCNCGLSSSKDRAEAWLNQGLANTVSSIGDFSCSCPPPSSPKCRARRPLVCREARLGGVAEPGFDQHRVRGMWLFLQLPVAMLVLAGRDGQAVGHHYQPLAEGGLRRVGLVHRRLLHLLGGQQGVPVQRRPALALPQPLEEQAVCESRSKSRGHWRRVRN